jgi:Fic family protein
MNVDWKIIKTGLLPAYRAAVDFDLEQQLLGKSEEVLPVDYFDFYNSISSVYSSKIEGEEIDFDSYFKHRFLHVEYQPDYTKKADDLFRAYQFIQGLELSKANLLEAHQILSKHLLPKSQRGLVRRNPMFVLNEADRIEYVACSPYEVEGELENLFKDIELLRQQSLDIVEVFYFAAMLHLVFVKIHPMQDGNGRTARLLEKWFLLDRLGDQAASIELEKNYYVNRQAYYDNIRKLGLDYQQLNYDKALDFLLMTAYSLK